MPTSVLLDKRSTRHRAVCWGLGRLFLSWIKAYGTCGGPGWFPVPVVVASGELPVRGPCWNPWHGWFWGNGSQFLFVQRLASWPFEAVT